MISISTSGLAYRVGTRDILTDVTFSLEDGDKLAVVGVNGSGKSTLLRLICGEYTPDEGSVYLAKNKIVGMLHQDDAFNILKLDSDDESPVDETVLGQMYAVFPELCRWEVRLAKLQEELDRASADSDMDALNRLSSEFTNLNNRYISDGGLHYKSRCRSILINLGFDESYHTMPVNALSGGQRTRLALARLLSREPDILILDEPTNHLDTETMAWLEEHLAAYKKTVILVSHDRLFLDRVTNKTLEIENTTSRLYKCNYSRYVVEKEAYRREMEKRYNLQQKEIARLEAYIAQQRAWNRERNIIAAESREKAIARMEKVEKPKALPKAISFTLTTSGESGNDVLEVKRLSMGFGEHILFRDLSFLIKKKERVFITGPNGCGKSTLIKLLLGQLEPLSGTIEFGYNVTVGYYDQENQKLDPDNTVLDELWNAYPNLTQTEVRNTLAMFMFRGDDIEKEVSVLSGGERARLTLAKLILSKMNLLILDEPTNHLDIDSREALETALSSFDGTIIAVSHDRYFTKKLATQFVDLGNSGTLYRGTYDEYMEHLAERKGGKVVAAEVKEQSAEKEEYQKRKSDGARRRQNEKRKVQIAREIKKLEEELISIEEELFGDAASDYIRASELTDRKITVEDLLMQLYEEEEELNAEE
ncbi:MAG: ABC-F family ATP-binding cassette domain-containing protein [Ruminococcaceae bacterium]|nr:ABC-F family ATP-binding cassette domain-containing protein [Oscillospiraceae bacterium]